MLFRSAFQRKLLALLFICGGQPPRATEFMTHRIRNGVNTERTIYMVGGEVMLLLRYNKTRSRTKYNRLIPRFLDREVSELLTLYISVARPLEVLFVSILNGTEAARTHRECLFSENGVPFSESTVRSTLASEFSKARIPLTTAQFRQWAIAMTRLHLKYPSQRSVSYFDEQCGHSENIGDTHYGRSERDHRLVTPSDIHYFRDCSRKWHQLVSFFGIWKHPGSAAPLSSCIDLPEVAQDGARGLTPSLKKTDPNSPTAQEIGRAHV